MFRFFKNKILIAVLAMAMIGSVAGCGASSAEIITDDGSDVASAYKNTDVGYTVPVQIPNILVDQLGYSSSSDKVALFRGEGLPSHFEVRSLESGEVVYTGDIMKSVYNEELDEYDSLGYFTDLETEGEYYLYADTLGESYSFSIKEDAYRDLFDGALKKYYINRCGLALSQNYAGENAHSACHTTPAHLSEDAATQIDVTGGWHMDEEAKRDAAIGCRISENLLLAYELNGSAFNDDCGIPESGNGIPDVLDEVRYEVDWLLKMQESRTGGIYGAAVCDLSKGSEVFLAPVNVTPISMEATISFASMMARFSYLYRQYDQEFATSCLQAADRAWECFLNNKKAAEDPAAFNAAAQLYRATGDAAYHETLDEWFLKNDFEEFFNSDENIFLGSVTYLSINQKVDVDRCTYLMKLLMNRSEDIAKRASSSTYLVTAYGGKESYDQILKDMRCLSITDHIIYNHEYTTIIENHVHYLSGMNPDAVNFLSAGTERSYEDAQKSGITNDPEKSAYLIFMLSVLEQ